MMRMMIIIIIITISLIGSYMDGDVDNDCIVHTLAVYYVVLFSDGKTN